MSSNPVTRVIIVDDHALQLHALCDTLRDQGFYTVGFTNGPDALKELETSEFDLLLTDLEMPEMDGIAVLQSALKIDPQLVGILLTGKGTIETAVSAMQAGALDYVLKPVKLSAILPVLSRAVNTRRLRMENMELRNTVAIHELNQAIAHTLDEDILLNKIGEAVIAQFNGDEASIMLVSAEGDSLDVAAVWGAHREQLLGIRVPIGEGIAGRVAVTHEPVLLDGLSDNTNTASLYPRTDLSSSLSMPMVVRNNLIGVLNVSSLHRNNNFPPGQVVAMSIFTNAAATGIEAARLYENQRKADSRYRQVLDMAADAIVSVDDRFCITVFNSAAERIFGWTASEVYGKSLDILIPVGSRNAHHGHIAKFDAAANLRSRGPFMSLRKDGTEFPAEISISKDIEDGCYVYTAVLRDITLRLQHENKIMRLSRIHAVLGGINSAIARIRVRDDLFKEVCRIAVEEGKFRMAWIGLADSDLKKARPVAWMGVVDGYLDDVGQKLDEMDVDQGGTGQALRGKQSIIFNNIEKDQDVAFRREALARGYRSLAVMPLLVHKMSVGIMALYASECDYFDHEEIKLLEDLAGDVSLALEVMQKDGQLVRLAHYNVITELPNRKLYMERLQQRIHGTQHVNKTFALVVLDLERFRNINETLGRHVGDEVLRYFGDNLTNSIVAQDLLGHIGNDDFIIALRSIENDAKIVDLIEQILASALSTAFKSDNVSLQLAVRAGIAFYPKDGAAAEKLMQSAEAALREAKRTAQKYQFYMENMSSNVSRALLMENRLRGALGRGEFLLHYQPKVNLQTDQIAGMEALIRWRDSENGLVSPLQFIPLLEETGMILEVGHWVIEEALRAVAALRASGLPNIPIAVNVSPIQLRQDNFVALVARAVSAGGDEHHGIELEITESVVMEDVVANVQKLSELCDLGIEISIDDFGTGYSSLAYVATLPAKVIKIDRSFIQNITTNENSRLIAMSIISLAHSLDRIVVAEGVETEEQASLLRSLKCDSYQGYLFSKPLPLEDITKLLLSKKLVTTSGF